MEILKQNNHIHEVLFNSQWDRSCAIGDIRLCNQSQLSLGGWNQNVSKSKTTYNGNYNLRMEFSLHEFGLIPNRCTSAGQLGIRHHDFSYWPGFSFNPGMWDIHKLKKSLGSNVNDNNAEWGNFFSETDIAFEHQFSILCHSRDVHMAYLHAVLFKHIGTEISAYSLNGYARPWEATI